MAARLFLLVLLVWMGGLVDTYAQGTGGQCLVCHSQHYEDLASCTFCHRGDNRTSRSSLAHRNLIPARMSGFAFPGDRKLRYGLMMLDRLACRRCHSWGGKGGRLASGLDSVYYTKPVEELAEALSRPTAQMPDFALDEGQVEAVVSALLKTSQGGAEAEAESQAPVVIHFNLERSEQEHPFDVRCGSCHRLLTNRFGALGGGDVAPNLSGLLDGYFPELEDGRPWTVGLLRKWLGNPRRLRKNALMQPVLLKEEELSKILEVFFDTDDECASHVISSGMKN